jgi:poly-beta-1,6-N-acetyl-D-glucosamine synthase
VTARVLLVSPVRNEAAHIERVVRGVAAQTRPPAVWVVVDDGSTDGTAERVEALAREVTFLRLVRTPPGFTEGGTDRLAAAAAPRAFNFGLSAAGGPAGFTHVGKLDGDTELPSDYFERLLAEFERDPRLGIGGGVRLEPDGRGGWRSLPIPRAHVPGALKLYTVECLAAIGGMLELLGWDTIDETYARMRGFTTRSFPALETLHHRAWGTADGSLRGRVRYGHSSYVARQGPLWVALKAAKVARLSPRGVSGAAFLYGYARAWARSAPRIEDEAFVRFVRRELRARMLRLGSA